MTDEELIAGCLAGHKKSWDRFCDRFSKLIHWSIRQTLADSSFRGRQELCGEIFQEIFRKLLERGELSKLKQVDSVRKFLSVLSCHATMDRLKRLRVEESLTFNPEEKEEAAPGTERFAVFTTREDVSKKAANDEHREILSRALASLRPKERAALEFYYLEGLSHRSIGELLGDTEDSIETLIRRTWEKMRQTLLEKGVEGI